MGGRKERKKGGRGEREQGRKKGRKEGEREVWTIGLKDHLMATTCTVSS